MSIHGLIIRISCKYWHKYYNYSALLVFTKTKNNQIHRNNFFVEIHNLSTLWAIDTVLESTVRYHVCTNWKLESGTLSPPEKAPSVWSIGNTVLPVLVPYHGRDSNDILVVVYLYQEESRCQRRQLIWKKNCSQKIILVLYYR